MSTPTPSLRRRVVLLGVGAVALVLVVVNLTVYAALRASLYETVDDLLGDRVDVVHVEQQQVAPGPAAGAELARRLQARGVRATVTAPDGRVFRSEPGVPTGAGDLPPPSGPGLFASRDVELDGGTTVQVLVRTSGVEATLRRLRVLQGSSSLAAVLLAALLLGRSASRALQPVADIADAAARTASGQRGQRLQPDRPGTELGQMATAYDEMLDALEEGLQVADALERRGEALETRWRQVLEAAQEAYVAVDATGGVVDWNYRAEELMGFAREEVVGQPVTALVPEAGREALSVVLARLVERGPAELGPAYELVVRTASGREFTAEVTVWGVDRRGGTVVHAFARDISQRHHAQQVSARLAAVVDGSTDAIVTEDLDGIIRSWNAAAELSYGWSAGEAVGRHMSLVLTPEGRAEHARMQTRVVQGAAMAGYEGEHVTRSGRSSPVSVRLSPVHDAQGHVVGVSSIIRDTTEQRALADTLAETLVALESAVQEAQDSAERMRSFLADAAHQLRTPVAGISATAETLLRGVPPETAHELLAHLVRESARTARLVTGMLQVARLDRGPALVLEDCDVGKVCRDEAVRAQVLAPHLEVRWQAQAHLPAARLDRVALHDIVANLVDNARRHATSSVRIEVSADDDTVWIAVRDDGPGIPADLRERVFHRFVSLDGRGGSGLGLPIARGFAEAMGGQLRYDDGFLVTLPLRRASGKGGRSAGRGPDEQVAEQTAEGQARGLDCHRQQ